MQKKKKKERFVLETAVGKELRYILNEKLAGCERSNVNKMK